jgi:hypothetical protein
MVERVADHIAGVLMGLILAGLVTAAMSWLWPEMRLAALFVFVLFWGFTTISTTLAERHNLVRTSFSGWRYVSSKELRKRLPPSESIWGDMATLSLGAVVGLLVAGITGKLWSASRWPAFFIIFLLWTAIGVIAMTAGRRGD